MPIWNTLERNTQSDVSAATALAATFALRGGKYYVQTNSTGTGTIDLKRKDLSGAAWTAQITQITATAGKQTIDLPPGEYRWEITDFTANYLEVIRIGYEA